jgi:hypothetical protein
MNYALCPAQQRGFDQLQRILPLGNVFSLWGAAGCGRTTVFRLLHQDSAAPS